MLLCRRFVLLCLGMLYVASHTSAQECVDQSWCEGFKSFCNDDNFREQMQTLCPVVCGTCPDSNSSAKCSNNNGGCHHLCRIEKNNEICHCLPGYRLLENGVNCTDINECDNVGACPTIEEPYCINRRGSYSCSGELCSANRTGHVNQYKSEECCAIEEDAPCGRDSIGPGRIVGGDKADYGGWPWMVYILIDSTGGRVVCGGTLIDEYWVVTAAHCFTDAINGSRVDTFFGRIKPNAKPHEEPLVQERTATEVILHPEWDRKQFPYHDIALLRLSSPVQLDDYINKACLPNGEKPSPGTRCWVTGFGTTAYRGFAAKSLQEVDLPIVDMQKCIDVYNGTEYPIAEDWMFCAGYEDGGKDACQGDSGGPLVCQRCSSCSWYVAGVVSFGKGCARAKYYGVYTDVEYHEMWISETTGISVAKDKACGGPARPRWSSWGQWSVCTKTCAAGSRMRSRICLNDNSEGNGCSGINSQTDQCNTQECPYWGNYGEWSECDATCGGGKRMRTRNCIGGAPGDAGCDVGLIPVSETEDCNSQPCPMWKNWSSWTICTATCGGGTRNSVRVCDTGGVPGAKCQGQLRRTENCQEQQCPRWNSWESWNECTVTCDGGMRSRNRVCLHGQIDDIGCQGSNTMTEECNTERCGVWTAWKAWSDCSLSCGGGRQTSVRMCTGGIPGKGGCPGKQTRSRTCMSQDCPKWSSWGRYSTCSRSCDRGTKTRTRSCENGEPREEGCLGSHENSVNCNTQACPMWTKWTEWTACSASCGSGNHQSTRSCSNGLVGEKGCLGEDNRNEVCNSQPCPRWSSYTSWSECSNTCGGGKNTRTRSCLHGNPGDVGCHVGNTEIHRPCNTDTCPYWGQWRNDGDCSKTCGNGKISQRRFCMEGNIGEAGCVGRASRLIDCQIKECPGSWSNWSDYAQCSVDCGEGWKTRSRACEGGNIGGEGCKGTAVQNITCNMLCLPKWDSWQQWSTCTRSCYGGTRTRYRACIDGVPGQPNCTPAKKSMEMEVCNEEPCPECEDKILGCTPSFCTAYRAYSQQNCKRTCGFCSSSPPWGQWSRCSATCDGGIQYRNRTCAVSRTRCNDAQSQIRGCGQEECTGYTQWETWTDCTASCNVGEKRRRRSCPVGVECLPDEHGSATMQRENCNEQTCPGQWSKWSFTSDCSVTCGSGTRERQRQCLGGVIGGPGCEGPAINRADCVLTQCPGGWSEWKPGICTATCGNGTLVETRQCVGGIAGEVGCEGNHRRETTCNLGICVTMWENWSNWKACSATCGAGIRVRRRNCLNGKVGDRGCIGDTMENESCNSEMCESMIGACAGLQDNLPPSQGTCQQYISACLTHPHFSRRNCALTCCKQRIETSSCSDTTGFTDQCRQNIQLCNIPQYRQQFMTNCRRTCGFC